MTLQVKVLDAQSDNPSFNLIFRPCMGKEGNYFHKFSSDFLMHVLAHVHSPTYIHAHMPTHAHINKCLYKLLTVDFGTLKNSSKRDKVLNKNYLLNVQYDCAII